MVTLYLHDFPGSNVIGHLNENPFGLPEQIVFPKVHMFHEKSNVVHMLLDSPTVLIVGIFLEGPFLWDNPSLSAVLPDQERLKLVCHV